MSTTTTPTPADYTIRSWLLSDALFGPNGPNSREFSAAAYQAYADGLAVIRAELQALATEDCRSKELVLEQLAEREESWRAKAARCGAPPAVYAGLD